MITSKIGNRTEAYVWIYLPQKIMPCVAGKIAKENEKYIFTYGQSYLGNPDRISLSAFELELKRGNYYPEGMNTIHSCLRDAGPDAWGRPFAKKPSSRKETRKNYGENQY